MIYNGDKVTNTTKRESNKDQTKTPLLKITLSPLVILVKSSIYTFNK